MFPSLLVAGYSLGRNGRVRTGRITLEASVQGAEYLAHTVIAEGLGREKGFQSESDHFIEKLS